MYSTTATGNMLATTALDRLPEVQSEVEQLGFQLECLDKCVERLADKLVPVLANRSVDQAGGPSAPEPVRVPLAEVLHQRLLLLTTLTRRLDELTERVEL